MKSVQHSKYSCTVRKGLLILGSFSQVVGASSMHSACFTSVAFEEELEMLVEMLGKLVEMLGESVEILGSVPRRGLLNLNLPRLNLLDLNMLD